jgi:hypothetical protein
LAFDAANRISAKYSLDSGKGSLKYSYTHTSGVTFEPAYDFSSDAFIFAASQKFRGEDTVKAEYETSKKLLNFEWIRDSKETGSFKVYMSIYIFSFHRDNHIATSLTNHNAIFFYCICVFLIHSFRRLHALFPQMRRKLES